MKKKNGIILITGGSRGIGEAAVRCAAEEGYSVWFTYYEKEKKAQQIKGSIIQQGISCNCIRANLSCKNDIHSLFSQIDEAGEPILALVNNASISGVRSFLAETDDENIERIIKTNLLGYFLCAKEVVKRMAISKGGMGGSIINISSQAAVSGGWQLTPYAASKAGVNAFTLGLAKEVASEGIRVNAISPGKIDTDMSSHDMGVNSENGAMHIPLGRMGTPDEVANAVMWLISDKASYITGAILPVAGGFV